jgi:hypothetical protein
MNFPVGEIMAKEFLPDDIQKIILDLNKKNFSGYIVQSVSESCFEEGVLFFKEGELLGAVTECKEAGNELKGNEAFVQFLNQTKGRGYYQIVKLTESQVDLVVAFDKKILMGSKINLKGLPKLIPSKFEDKFTKQSEKQFKKNSLVDLKRSLIGG